MPITAAIITLSLDPEARADCLAALSHRPDVELGPVQTDVLPLVVSTPGAARHRQVLEQLRTLPGADLFRIVYTLGIDEAASARGGQP